jgi:hypothetical protein
MYAYIQIAYGKADDPAQHFACIFKQLIPMDAMVPAAVAAPALHALLLPAVLKVGA